MQKNKPVIGWDTYGALPALNGEASLGYAGPVTGITNDILVVGGGANFPAGMPWNGGAKKYYDIVFLSAINQQPAAFQTAKLPYPVAYSANCSVPGAIVSAGGENEEGPTDKVLLLEWINHALEISSLPDLPLPITNAVATAVGQKVYLAGGETVTGTSDGYYSLDLADTSLGWRPLASIPHAVSHAVLAASVDGKYIFLSGGRKKNASGISDLYNKVYAYDVFNNSWVEKASLPYALSAGTGIAVNDRYIALFGGDRGSSFHETEVLISRINNETDSIKKQYLIDQKAKLQSEHPGFSSALLLYDIEKDEWGIDGSIPFITPVTTTAVRQGTTVLIPSGEIKAGVRTPQILRGKIDH